MALITVAGVIFLYIAIIFLLYKFFEKFFKIVFFLITALFVVGLLYLMAKGL